MLPFSSMAGPLRTQVAAPWLMKLAIDSLEDPELTSGRVAVFASLIVVAAVLGGAARFGMRQLLNSISRRMEAVS